MCDYSLHAHPNRLAAEGETLAVTRFIGGSKGFASVHEIQCRKEIEAARPKFEWSWEWIRSWRQRVAPKEPLTAVCIPPGAQLLLEGIPQSLRDSLGVSESEHVTFTQLGFDSYAYRDAVRFRNGREILIQRLADDQRAIVLSLGGDEDPVGGEPGVSDPATLEVCT
jgi:hypothetical protein